MTNLQSRGRPPASKRLDIDRRLDREIDVIEINRFQIVNIPQTICKWLFARSRVVFFRAVWPGIRFFVLLCDQDLQKFYNHPKTFQQLFATALIFYFYAKRISIFCNSQ